MESGIASEIPLLEGIITRNDVYCCSCFACGGWWGMLVLAR